MMKQQEVLKKIGSIISELSEQHQYLQAEEGHLNSLELELFVANAHFLTDHAEVLRKICNAQAPKEPAVHLTPEPERAPQEILQLSAADAEPVINIPSAGPEPVTEETAPADELPLVEPIAEELPPEPEPAAPKEAIPAVPESEPEPEPVTSPATPYIPPVTTGPVPDVNLGAQQDTYNYVRQSPEPVEEHTFSISSSRTSDEPAPPVTNLSAFGTAQQEEPPKPTVVEAAPAAAPAAATKKEEPAVLTLNQRLSAQMGGGVQASATTASSAKPVTDLKTAVSLNDKMLFVRDLFNGYNLAYNEAIELLNRCKTFDEADRLLKANYVAKNNWAAKQATADKFYAVLHRRFA